MQSNPSSLQPITPTRSSGRAVKVSVKENEVPTEKKKFYLLSEAGTAEARRLH